jgi:uncharacterized Fe-S cluster protein YjdI
MDPEEEHFTHGDLTVVWKKDLCTHSQRCFKELPAVFDPPGDAFVDLSAAAAPVIMAQVDRCPSGALSYLVKGQPVQPRAGEAGHVTIELLKDGPILVKSGIVIRDAGGSETHRPGPTALCRCGASGTKPLCDGAHSRIGFTAG